MSAWIMLRGLTRETRHWGTLPQRVSDAFDGARVLPVDLPGNGEFAALHSYRSVADMVGFVRLVALDSGVPGPYRLLAMSLGGMVATDWAQRHPHEIESLALINTSMRPFNRPYERLRPHAWPVLMRIAAHWRDPRAAESAIHALTCNNRRTLADDLDAWIAIRRSAPVSRANALRQLIAAASFRAALQPPSCRTLILSSAADALVDPACSASIAAAWRAPHRQHADAGHDLPHDDPAWVVEQLHDGLRQHAS
ncbi:alpha/beta fold hydrolase [Paraburkholderia solisilvae]|uniref:2-succinyl-6-hydroxy-2, 4-cyclohexadiene-1-carboxylate synthase n=1 Tax=Paraburkholderia solisilvae TaxID=624376 RepID=A0A6J5EQB7_9BURK|nr:alpha/beta hydrolase [Paraburkholderia solisilvae]CAB3768788.1 2-succinyl-6-hydroxy-2, 4-cyclohexadiene-1-carboxylate synthase [Paraburkholderia solisilvae]